MQDWIAVPDWPVVGAFALAGLVLLVTPGPDMTLMLSRTLAKGRAAGMACTTGAMTGIVVHTLLAALGISALLAASPRAFAVLKVAGALYLAWLAVQALRTGTVGGLDLAAAPGPGRRSGLWRDYLTGVGINLLNPKVVLFFVTFLPQFVTAGDPQAAGKLLFLGLLFVAMALPSLFAMVLVADRFARALTSNPHVARAIDIAFATIFGAFAVRILLARAD